MITRRGGNDVIVVVVVPDLLHMKTRKRRRINIRCRRRSSTKHVIRNFLLLLLWVMERMISLELWTNAEVRIRGCGSGEEASAAVLCGGGDADAATWRDGARMLVLAFVGGDDNGGVVAGSLNSLLDAAAGGSATVVAPVVYQRQTFFFYL